MQFLFCALILTIGYRLVNSAVMVYPIKVGEQLILDLGKDLKMWSRHIDGQDEHIRACKTDEEPYDTCNIWMDSNGKKVKDNDKRSHVFPNGTLVINNVQLADSGSYSSDDEMRKIRYTEDGSIYELAKTRINVVVQS